MRVLIFQPMETVLLDQIYHASAVVGRVPLKHWQQDGSTRVIGSRAVEVPESARSELRSGSFICLSSLVGVPLKSGDLISQIPQFVVSRHPRWSGRVRDQDRRERRDWFLLNRLELGIADTAPEMVVTNRRESSQFLCAYSVRERNFYSFFFFFFFF